MTQAPEIDVWQTGTGLVDDIDAYLSETYFGIDERYNSQAVVFCATLVDAQGEPQTTLRLSVGQDWVTNQEGTEISNPNRAQINNNSRFGRFIDRLARPTTERAPKNKNVVSPPGMENGLGLVDLLRSRGTPFQAKTFEGLGFHWNLHRMETMGKDENDQIIMKDVLFPVRYLGEYGKSAATTRGAAAPGRVSPPAAQPAARVPAPTAASPAATNGAGVELPIPLRKKLTLLALQNDLPTYLKAAGRDLEVLSLPDAVMGHILDSSAEGFHAQAQG